jgi:pimeloyl-ACP methyl ester carboxylesterase
VGFSPFVRRLLFVLALIAVALPSLGAASGPASPTKKKCKIVTRVVHGKRKKVRVCHKVKPHKPKPPHPPPPAPPPPAPPPPPVQGKKVDIGGYSLYVECAGTGSPTVVLDAGNTSSHRVWVNVRPDASRLTRVCAFDRAGNGDSDSRPGLGPNDPVPASRVIDELHALLHNGAIPGPYILTGASIGGLYSRLYTKQYPDDVAGIVLVDGTPEQEMAAGGFGVLPPEQIDMTAAVQELTGFSTGSRPLVVLEQHHDTVQDRAWQRSVAQRSTNAWWVRANGTNHNIELPPPEGNPPLVVEAIHQAVLALRNGGTLPACASSPITAANGDCLTP